MHSADEDLSFEDIAQLESERATEESLFQLADQLQALCTIQASLDSGECVVDGQTRFHFSQLLAAKALELRRLLGIVMG